MTISSNNLFFIVTGFTGEIGKNIASLLMRDGYSIIAVGRSLERLNKAINSLQVTDHTIIPFEADLSDSSSLQRLFDYILSNNFQINGLINCAGSAIYQDFDKHSQKQCVSSIELNVVASVRLSQFVIDILLKNNCPGMILNVASTAGLKPSSQHTLYNASKAFIINFTQGLALKYRKFGITISCLIPGSTKTAFFENSGIPISNKKWNSLPNAERISKIAVKGLKDGKVLIIPTFKHQLQSIFAKLLPSKILFLVQQIRENSK